MTPQRGIILAQRRRDAEERGSRIRVNGMANLLFIFLVGNDEQINGLVFIPKLSAPLRLCGKTPSASDSYG
jgi:hypothetical protein